MLSEDDLMPRKEETTLLTKQLIQLAMEVIVCSVAEFAPRRESYPGVINHKFRSVMDMASVLCPIGQL